MYLGTEAGYRKSPLIARCISILLVIAVCFVNAPLSFADFASDGTVTFSASITIPGGGDSDYDGMSDEWERAHGLNPNDPEDAYYDNDNDGINNLEEYRLATDPIQPNNPLRATLTATPSSGSQPLEVILIADVTGGIPVKYEWDFDVNRTYDHPEWEFDRNGTYDYFCYASEGNAVAYRYTSAGRYYEGGTERRFHVAKLRATDSLGQTAVATAVIYVDKSALSPTAAPDLSLARLTIPMALELSGTASGPKEIARYEWDTNGNGEYDISSSRAASVTRTYNETVTKSFYAAFKVTDTAGLSDISTVGIEADAADWNGANAPYKPKVYPNDYIVYGRAGVPVSLGGYGAPAVGYAKKLEWDFENDGVCDWSSSIDNTDWTGRADTTHSYGAPGIYRAVLKVHTEANVSATDTVLVIISANGTPPVARGRVSYNGTDGILAIPDGVIPVKAKFSHSTSSGSIVKYEWDFDGDKKIDYTTASAGDEPTFDYRFPGYCLATLKVTDANGLIDTYYIPVFAVYPTDYASNIIMPKESQILAGNAVTLVANVFPDDSGVASVIFQYKKPQDAAWTDIGPGRPIMSYMTRWDTTGLIDGTTYQLRAIVNSRDSASFKATPVKVDNTAAHPDIYEYTNGTHTKKVVVDPDEANLIAMPDGTHIEIPAGSLPEGQTQVVTIEEVIEKTAGVGGSMNITMTGTERFVKDMTLSMPYPDEDDDGVVDGTDIDENSLVVKWLNPDTGEWEPLYDSVVHPDENYVSARINHLSLFGIGPLIAGGGGIAGSSAATANSSRTISYCFIATAAYGTPMAEDVVLLREFRDRCLIRNPAGRTFIRYYYRYSPPIARFIEEKPALRKAARFLLKPMVKIAKEMLHRGGGAR